MKAEKKYKVKFKYQTDSSHYSIAIGDNLKVLKETKINPQLDTKEYSITFTASMSGNSWIGIVKKEEITTDFILDDLVVLELNKKDKTIN